MTNNIYKAKNFYGEPNKEIFFAKVADEYVLGSDGNIYEILPDSKEDIEKSIYEENLFFNPYNLFSYEYLGSSRTLSEYQDNQEWVFDDNEYISDFTQIYYEFNSTDDKGSIYKPFAEYDVFLAEIQISDTGECEYKLFTYQDDAKKWLEERLSKLNVN